MRRGPVSAGAIAEEHIRPAAGTADSYAAPVIVVAAETIPDDPDERRLAASWMECWGSDAQIIAFGPRASLLDAAFGRARVDLLLALRAARVARSMSPRALLAHREATGLALALLKRLGLFSAKLYIYSHAPLSNGPIHLKTLLTRLGAWDVMVCLSEEEAVRFTAKYRVDPARVTVNPLPCNTDLYRPVDTAGSSASNGFVFSAGVSHRDYPTLMQAMRLLPAVRCVIDPSSPSDRAKGTDWTTTLPPNVSLGSFPNPSSFTDIVGRCSIVALAIQPDTDQLSAGCTLANVAAAMGKPVVAASPGLRTYIAEGESGLLVPAGNPRALADAIEYLWRNPDVAERMGRRARQLAEERLSPCAWVQHFQAILA